MNAPAQDTATSENGEVASGVDVWAKSLLQGYWIPASGPRAEVTNSLQGLLDKFPTTTIRVFEPAYRALTESVKAVQHFLAMPYDLGRGIADQLQLRDGTDASLEQLIGVLAKTFQQPSVALQLQRMKQQAVVLLWSAYETFARDVFVIALNTQPSLYGQLMKTPLKEKFQTPQLFSFGGLETHQFSLEGKLGTAVAEGKDFSSPALLRVLFPQIFQNVKWSPQLAEAAECRELWILGHRRHVVAHRCGIVDAVYVSQTGDQQHIGQMLNVHGDEIDRCIAALARLATLTIISALADRMPSKG